MLFYDAIQTNKLIKLFVPSPLVPLISTRMATLTSMLAEGGANFWDAFQLIPVHDTFWLEQLLFSSFEVRHHTPRFCYGISLPGHFLFTGDTKPIPEVLNQHGSKGEIIFHDISTKAQPSHTCVEDLTMYQADQLERMWFYHFHDGNCISILRNKGLNCVDSRQVFRFEKDRVSRSAPYLYDQTGAGDAF